jgi:molybdopterin biosynthesis enzyme MoaB
VEAIIVNGGTDFADNPQVIVKLLDKKLDGFGEMFRF